MMKEFMPGCGNEFFQWLPRGGSETLTTFIHKAYWPDYITFLMPPEFKQQVGLESTRLAGVPSGSPPYPILVYGAALPWNTLAGALALVSSANLISDAYFPRRGEGPS